MSQFRLLFSDPIDEMGSRSSLSRDRDEGNMDVDHWEMNYHEAAIFLEVKRLLSNIINKVIWFIGIQTIY